MLFQIFINLPCKYVQICIQSSPRLESGFCAAKKTKTREKNKPKQNIKPNKSPKKYASSYFFLLLKFKLFNVKYFGLIGNLACSKNFTFKHTNHYLIMAFMICCVSFTLSFLPLARSLALSFSSSSLFRVWFGFFCGACVTTCSTWLKCIHNTKYFFFFLSIFLYHFY